MERKALLSLVDFNNAPYGVLRVTRRDLCVSFSLTRVGGESVNGLTLVASDDDKNLVITDFNGEKNCPLDVDNFAVLIVENNKGVVFSKKGRCAVKKQTLFGFFMQGLAFNGDESLNKNSLNTAYNDEAIATENYYLKEGVCFESNQTDNYAKAKTDGFKDWQEKTRQAQAFGDEAHQEYVRKPFTTTRGATDHAQSSDLSCEASQGFFERRSQQFLSGLNFASPNLHLQNLIPNSKFYPSTQGKKPYLFGVISSGEKPRFLAYAVSHKDAQQTSDFHDWYFIPNDYFDKQKGYFVLLQDALSGAKV